MITKLALALSISFSTAACLTDAPTEDVPPNPDEAIADRTHPEEDADQVINEPAGPDYFTRRRTAESILGIDLGDVPAMTEVQPSPGGANLKARQTTTTICWTLDEPVDGYEWACCQWVETQIDDWNSEPQVSCWYK